MKLVKTEMSPEESAEQLGVAYEQPKYPYGLKICLNNELLEKLGIEDLPKIGEVLKVECVVEVCSLNAMKEMDGEVCKSMDLQIVEIGVDKAKKSTAEMAKDFYKE